MNKIVLVLVHKLVDGKGVPVVRVIAFDAVDEDGRSVVDILEANLDCPRGLRWLAVEAERYGAPVVMQNADDIQISLDMFDTGRARKISSRVLRALEMM